MTRLGSWLGLCAFVTGCASPSFKESVDAGAPEPEDAAQAPYRPDGEQRDAGSPPSDAEPPRDAGQAPVDASRSDVVPPAQQPKPCVVGVSKIGECTL